ncbi:hypothetical protein KSX_58430 [Ktedonospora formicarum]|uniref:Uncharacterized protein n=1 Tax=Ktedonospora formicarum TaxID=2778364 RepID=A0A8J3MTZ6_9CHLR|nr:hypothetical protein KSX_58430 [Ktedonospora formicarum]
MEIVHAMVRGGPLEKGWREPVPRWRPILPHRRAPFGVASTGGILVARPHTHHRVEPVVSWLWHKGQEAPLPALASVCCGVGPIQRDLYSAFLAAYLDPTHPIPSCARYQVYWEGAEARLRAAHECLIQRAKEGQVLPRSLGLTRARARLPESLGEPPLEPALLLWREEQEAWAEPLEPPLLEHGELSVKITAHRCQFSLGEEASKAGLSSG